MVGDVVSHYRVIERLGGGAMGVVYRAEDTRLRRSVVLKFLPAELTGDEDATRRFMREARAASALDHRNICTVHEIGETDDGELFIVMPFYGGRTLKSVLAAGPLDPAAALNYALQVAAGLAHAGDHGVVHRDIKPANIMVTERNEVKIVDFGLARLKGSRRLTRTGAAIGTAAYMAPEQVQGAEVGPAADIWALGVVLYEMLTGRLPFTGESEPALLYSIVHTHPAPLSDGKREVPAVCETIVNECLTKRPEGRYGSAVDLRRDLEEASRILTPRPGQRDGLMAGRPGRLRRWTLPTVLAVVLALAAFTPTVRDAILKSVGLAADPPRGVAVLPFTVEGGGAEERAFADGLTWLLTDRLSRLEEHDGAFWVVPARIVWTYDAYTTDAARLKLGVDLTLVGTLRFGDGPLNASLIAFDSREGRTDSREVQDDMANLDTWQRQFHLVAAELLGMKSPPAGADPLRRGYTSVPGAFVDWLRGVGWTFALTDTSRYDLAEASFASAVAQDSSFACAWTSLGRSIWRARGRRDSTQAMIAAGYLRKAAELDSTLAWPHVYLGHIQSRWGDRINAVSSLEHALALDPRNSRAMELLGKIHHRSGDVDAAEAVYKRAVEARPGCVGAIQNLGELYFHEARFEQAAVQFGHLVELTPGSSWAHSYLGAAQFELKRYDVAQAELEKSIALEPTYSAYTNLGSLYYYRHRYGDAIEMFRSSLTIYDKNYNVWGNLGESYYWAPGLRDSSRAAFDKAIELAKLALEKDPGDPYVGPDLASYYGRIGDEERALEMLQHLETQENTIPESMFVIADAYEQIGRREKALDWLERACAADLPLAKVELYPGLRELRAHPGFREIEERYGG